MQSVREKRAGIMLKTKDGPMLYRKMYDELIDRKKKKVKKALLLTGARQIGKTFLVRAFGRQNYENFAEINFITEPRAASIFAGNLNAETLLMNLTAYLRAPMVPGKTLVFFDEIQECPEARTAIKFLVEDGRFDYIESGSLLGVNYKEVRSYPVGYEDTLRMYPMDFEEFVLANGLQEETLLAASENPEKSRNLLNIPAKYDKISIQGMEGAEHETIAFTRSGNTT